LAAALGELDRRRRAAVDVREMARDHAGAVGILTVACATGVLAVAIYRIATARRRRRVARMQMLVRVWRHPELTAPPKEGLLGKIGKVLVVSAARFLLARVLNSASDDMAPPRALTGSAA
jgi:hypothetical protein